MSQWILLGVTIACTLSSADTVDYTSDSNSVFSDLRGPTPASLSTCSHSLETPSLWLMCLTDLPLLLVQPHDFKYHLSICLQDHIRILSPTFVWSIRTFYPTTHSQLYLVIRKYTIVAIAFDYLACLHTPFLCNGTPLSCEEAMPGGWNLHILP